MLSLQLFWLMTSEIDKPALEIFLNFFFSTARRLEKILGESLAAVKRLSMDVDDIFTFEVEEDVWDSCYYWGLAKGLWEIPTKEKA